jgi:hypothetical protein
MPHNSWGAPCTGTRKTVVLSNGVKLPVRAEIAELIGLLCEETMRRGYRLVPGWCWGYACRKIAGSSSWSNHAWALAVDLNAPKNPMTSRLVTDMPSWMPALWKSYGFRWGGDYRGKKDAMHYEFMGSVAEAKAQTERARRELRPGAPKPAQSASVILTAGQIKWLAQTIAGLTGEDLVIATALGLAESEGKVTAYNGKGLDASYGIWQINTHGNLGPDRRGKLGLKSNDEFYDPAVNARAMRLVRQEAIAQRKHPWEPWGAFTDKRYLKRMDEARAAKPEPIQLEDDMFTEQDRSNLQFATDRGQETTNMLHGVNQRLDNIAALLEKLVAKPDAK